MKICVTVISELKTLIIELGEDESIETISTILSSELKTGVEYNFIFNKTICPSDKTIGELNFFEDCKVYAVKKNEKPLKRQLDNEPLNSILNFGCSAKKPFTLIDNDHFEYISWKNGNLDDVQSQLSDIVNENPALLEPLILQPQVEHLVHNPSAIMAMFSANAAVNESIINQPNSVKFFTDSSQYAWVKDIMGSSSELASVVGSHSENAKSAMESKRYRRMVELLEKTVDKTAVDADEATSSGKFDSKSLEPLTKSAPTAHKLLDTMRQHGHIAEAVLKCSPYGRQLAGATFGTVHQIVPDALQRIKEALEQSTDPDSMLQYLRAHPIEVDDSVDVAIKAMTDGFAGDGADQALEDQQEVPSVAVLMGTLADQLQRDVVATAVTNDASDDQLKVAAAAGDQLLAVDGRQHQKDILHEMGLCEDDVAADEVLASEYGNVDRAVNRLLPISIT